MKIILILLLSISVIKISFAFNSDYESIDTRSFNDWSIAEAVNSPRILCDMDYIPESVCGLVSITVGSELFKRTFSKPGIAKNIPEDGKVNESLMRDLLKYYWIPAKNYQYGDGVYMLPTQGQLQYMIDIEIITASNGKEFWARGEKNNEIHKATIGKNNAQYDTVANANYEMYLPRLVTKDLPSSCNDGFCPSFTNTSGFEIKLSSANSIRWGWFVEYVLISTGETKSSSGEWEATVNVPNGVKNVRVSMWRATQSNANLYDLETLRGDRDPVCVRLNGAVPYKVTIVDCYR